jgi:hypothetical protein
MNRIWMAVLVALWSWDASAATLIPKNALAGFCSSIENNDHLVIATTDGRVQDSAFSNSSQTQTLWTLVTFAPGSIVAVSAHFTPADWFGHAMVATNDGVIHEIFYSRVRGGAWLDTVASFPPQVYGNIVGMASYLSPNDGYQHVVVAFDQGSVQEYRWGGGPAAYHQIIPAWFYGNQIQDISAHYTANDQMEHVIVARKGGNVPLHEIYFQGFGGVSIATLSGSEVPYYYVAIDSFSPGTSWGLDDYDDIAVSHGWADPNHIYRFGPAGWFVEDTFETLNPPDSIAAFYESAGSGTKHIAYNIEGSLARSWKKLGDLDWSGPVIVNY